MGVEVKITTSAGFDVQVAAARRRALLKGGEVILQAYRAGAPRRTGEMVESGRVEFDMSPGGMEGVAIIIGAFYAQWEETKEKYHHPVGHAHALEMALVGGHEGALEVIAADIRKSLGL